MGSDRFHLTQIDEYAKLVGSDTIERIREKAKPLQGLHVAHVNSTYYGGGVSELLSSLTLLMNSVGIKTGWRVIQGSPDFFSVTKKMHNALQGGEINWTEKKKEIYEKVLFENHIRNHLDHDVVIIHDPQPLALIAHAPKKGPWIWRCHVDLSRPNPVIWEYLSKYLKMFDAMIASIPEYRQTVKLPQLIFMPAINPFSLKNRRLKDHEVTERLSHYHIPTDLPLVVQISRFDRWKDPKGVIEAFRKTRQEVDATLVLLGNVATDDPEGPEVYQNLLDQQGERIIILSKEDTALVNALQSRADVVMQKSIREGFGLTVSEAMWKGTPVIGGNVGGIRYQIRSGETGFLVNSVDEAVQSLVTLLKDPQKNKKMGQTARKTVRDHFLMIRLLENYLDLFNGFETQYHFKGQAGEIVL